MYRLCAIVLSAIAILPAAAGAGSNGAALNLGVSGCGVSIGNSLRWTGVRINYADRNVVAINGVNVTLWKSESNKTAVYNGLSVGIAPVGGSFHGANVGAFGVVASTRMIGLNVGGLGVVTDGSAIGLNVAGLGLVADGTMTGVNVSTLGTVADGGMYGLNVAGLGVVTDGDMMGVNVAGLGTVADGNMTGVNVAGLGVSTWRGWAWWRTAH